MSQSKKPTGEVVAPTRNISSLVLEETPYPLIPRVQPTSRVVMNWIKIGSTMEVMGFVKALSHLIFWKETLSDFGNLS